MVDVRQANGRQPKVCRSIYRCIIVLSVLESSWSMISFQFLIRISWLLRHQRLRISCGACIFQKTRTLYLLILINNFNAMPLSATMRCVKMYIERSYALYNLTISWALIPQVGVCSARHFRRLLLSHFHVCVRVFGVNVWYSFAAKDTPSSAINSGTPRMSIEYLYLGMNARRLRLISYWQCEAW